MVPKFFSEFEDLQDRAVDAVLDLCEDEDEKVNYSIRTSPTTAAYPGDTRIGL